ncbi:MAG: hypothetical protein A3G41_02950 [Elusimicrobia bacterium RIFCSPLOWO2_12_FULL_59_9]|nr:MAG: hypothetical protein A3G41_02950 [Elusimicrobia bacterium RIFCSPLOWO2_12_FULL_59_9]
MSKNYGLFRELVLTGLKRKNWSLRRLCRKVSLDPSFFSKVLAGKRNPPSEEHALRKIAEILSLPPARLMVAAGRIPSEWREKLSHPPTFQEIDARLAGVRETQAVAPIAESAAPALKRPRHLPDPELRAEREVLQIAFPKKDFAEELL